MFLLPYLFSHMYPLDTLSAVVFRIVDCPCGFSCDQLDVRKWRQDGITESLIPTSRRPDKNNLRKALSPLLVMWKTSEYESGKVPIGRGCVPAASSETYEFCVWRVAIMSRIGKHDLPVARKRFAMQRKDLAGKKRQSPIAVKTMPIDWSWNEDTPLLLRSESQWLDTRYYRSRKKHGRCGSYLRVATPDTLQTHDRELNRLTTDHLATVSRSSSCALLPSDLYVVVFAAVRRWYSSKR